MGLPEILPPEDRDVVQIWRWRVTPRTATFIKLGAAVSALGVAGWLLQNFLQLRGIVNLLASRIDLGFLALCIFVVGYALTIGVQQKRTWRIIIGIVVFIAAVGVDWWAPKPSVRSGDASSPVASQKTPISNSKIPSAANDLLSPLTATPAKLIFRDQHLGTTSDPQTVTVVNRESSRRTMSPLKMTGDFSQTNDCGPELMVGDSCDIAVTFAPTKIGLVYGNLEISSSSSPNPLGLTYTNSITVTLSGSGKAVPAVPPSRPKLAILPLVNCQQRGTSNSLAVGVAQKHGATITSLATDGREDQKAPFPRRPKRVLIEPPGSIVGVAELPRQVVLGKCGDRVCKLTVTEFADDGVTLDTRKATVFTEQQEICGVSVKMTVLDAK